MKIFEITEAKVEMCPEACCGKPVTECKCGPDCKHCDCYNKNKEDVKEGFLSNLVGDVRNAFKPGVQVTPNMVKELEAGLAAIKAGGQPTPRQQKIFDRFMSDTLAKELKKMGMSEASKNVSETPLAAWPAVAYAASRIPPTTYAGAATAIGTTIAKAIKHFEELIKRNPKHPKVSKVKAALAWLMITKAQALADETASPNDAASAESISETKPDMNKVLTALKKKLKDEGGAAGFKPLKDVASKMDIDLTPAMLKKMSGIKMHRDGDYILEEVKNV